MEQTELAERLHRAATQAQPIAQLSESSSFDIDEAYAIQSELVAHRVQEGNPIIGLKMGFTSEAKMKQMGVHDMIWGRLTQDMLIQAGDQLPLSKFIHPRAEPEIAFRISKDIGYEIPLDELENYVDGMAAAIEVIDSRFQNFKFNLYDVVADNCSSTGFVVGDWHTPHRNITNLNMQLRFNQEVIEEGSSKAILGDPWKALQAATRLAAQYGEPIKAGYVILAGAATPAAFLKPHQAVQVEVQDLGNVGFETVD
jgi:2-oxo-3-hexenedioate decarboxylase